MERNKRKAWMFIAAGITLAVFGISRLEGIDSFVQHARENAGKSYGPAPYSLGTPLFAMAHMDEWEQRRATTLEKVQQAAKLHYVKPENARVDRVWKAIPAYNGVEVDIEQTMALAEQRWFPDDLELVFREVPAAIQLEHLGAHPVYKGNPNKPMVAFMINVAWKEENLPGMLETLRKHDVKATFFFDGTWLSKHLDLARQIMEEGHEMSNHAYSHKDMSRLGRSQTITEISKTESLLKERLGVHNKLFAPPSGDYSQLTVEVAHEMKLTTVLWTLDTVDWKEPSSASVLRKISSQVEPGSLILMHPTKASSGALEGMIQAIKGKGLAIGTVSETLSPKRIVKVESSGQ